MGEFFATLGQDYEKTGWITDKGEFIECGPYDHDKVVENRGFQVAEIEKKWIRISLLTGKNYLQFQGYKINRAQHKALEEWGMLKRKVHASQQFQDAYLR